MKACFWAPIYQRSFSRRVSGRAHPDAHEAMPLFRGAEPVDKQGLLLGLIMGST